MDKFIENTIKRAGQSTLKLFAKPKVLYVKKHKFDFVTSADLISDNLIVNSIKKKFPKHGIISEESGKYNETSDWVWIIDPLDGTRNFLKGVHFWGILIGLSYKNKMQKAAAYFPFFDELFYAEAGNGVYRNKVKIVCGNEKELKNSTGCLNLDPRRTQEIGFINKLHENFSNDPIFLTSLNCGSFMACMVADGRRDWQIIFSGGEIWDHAVTTFILKEAGCRVTNLDGIEQSYEDEGYVAGNAILHKELMKIVKTQMSFEN